MGNVIISAITKAERLARYRMPSTSTVTEAVTTLVNGTDDVAKQAQRLARKAKYNSQFQTNPNGDSFVREVTHTAQTGRATEIARLDANTVRILNRFKNYSGKDINSIPVEDCIELKNLLVSTFRTGSIDTKSLSILKTELPFMTNNPKEYLKLLERLEQRIQQYPIKFDYKSIPQVLTETSAINRYNTLGTTDKVMVDLLQSLKGLSTKEASIIINQSGTRFGLSIDEQVRLARMYEANNILKGRSSVTPTEIEHIAYRLQNPKDLELFSIVEPSACKIHNDKLIQSLSKVARKQIQGLEQTSQSEILRYAKETNLLGHRVKICDIDDIKQVSGFYHTPESYGDGMMGNLQGLSDLTVSNDIYRRFANFKTVFSKPTNDMPVCYTYGTKDNCILWADNGFFVNVPKRSIHAGGTSDLGSHCSNLDSCIDSYVFGLSTGSNNVGEMLQKGLSVPEVLSKTTTHNEYLCSNGLIQAFYTNNIKTMDKAYLELAERFNIPILNLKGKGIVHG